MKSKELYEEAQNLIEIVGQEEFINQVLIYFSSDQLERFINDFKKDLDLDE